jgi:hypothetical protein
MLTLIARLHDEFASRAGSVLPHACTSWLWRRIGSKEGIVIPELKLVERDTSS